jgi:toxin ParE1/3/4
MGSYELSEAAALDFENIFNFGIDTFGITQALEYQHGMKKRFVELANKPKLYAAVDDVRAGYRRSVYTSHSTYYRIEPNRVFIVRILGQQDPHKALRKNDNP